MKLNQLILALIVTCSIIPPAIAQGSLPSLEDGMRRDRVRQQQSLDAQSQYNSSQSQASLSAGDIFGSILVASVIVGPAVFFAFKFKLL
ncbi:hypothetical protein [Nostoc sp.]|uniref:hypothetical protein n=1 Tax=Nostoc sp. TaxID=1180 RepID=UPI002FF6DD07